MPDSSLTTAEKIDFGACRAVKLTCVSEIGWSSNDGLMQDIAGGGIAASQWHISLARGKRAAVVACSKLKASTARAGDC